MDPERSGFYARTFDSLLDDGVADRPMQVLVVAGGDLDREVFRRLRFEDVTVTDLEDGADAEDLRFEDESFDLVGVSAGLHPLPVAARLPFRWVRNTAIPNYVYRWSVREVEKTIASYALHRIRFVLELEVPMSLVQMTAGHSVRSSSTSPFRRSVCSLVSLPGRRTSSPSPSSSLARLQPWLREGEHGRSPM